MSENTFVETTDAQSTGNNPAIPDSHEPAKATAISVADLKDRHCACPTDDDQVYNN